MRKKLKDLKGGEILEKEVITEDFKVLLSKGTVLKKDYIDKLEELKIGEVYVRDKEIPEEELGILKENIEDNIKTHVKEILEHHTYQHNDELKELNETADKIIDNILEEDEVVERVYDIRERSEDIYEHSLSISTMAILVAVKLKIPQEKTHDIGVGCLLHDIGIRYLPLELQKRKLSDMNEQELSEYKKHPVYGYSVLKSENWIHEISKQIILYHHERLDSSGYPLKASEIPYECQIVNVCDEFDEMICGINRDSVKVYEAIEYLKTFKNIKFNGTIADTFLEFIAVYPAGSHVLTNEGEEGIVLYQNQDFPDRPVLRIIRDRNGNILTSPVIKDLIHLNSIFIEKEID